MENVEVNKMPYITSIERIGREEGLQQGLQQGLQGLQQMIIEALDERLGDVPAPISGAIHQIQAPDRLRTLMRRVIRSASLEEFQQTLNGN
ncbi:hypothetical protein HYR99_03465 [Candidatus Poribacteria bacterium]|nr:hypothetical protein [Candidatus Poribacteria bacterium]